VALIGLFPFTSQRAGGCPYALAGSFFGQAAVAVFPKPLPSSRVGLHEGRVTSVAEKHADLVHAKPEKIVYPAQLADIPAASAGGSMAGFHSGVFYPRQRAG